MNHWNNRSLLSINGERWEWVNNFKGLYKVSSLGRIKSVNRIDSKGREWFDLILKQRKNSRTNRLFVFLSKDGVLYQFRVHRLVCAAFHKNRLLLPEVNHIDGDKDNNAASNLEWNSKADNIEHARVNGLCARGQKNGATKLTDKMVLKIFKNKGTWTEISEKFGVDIRHVHGIKSGKIWGWLTGKTYLPEPRKISKRQVINIFKSNLPLKPLSKKYNCSLSAISMIKNGKMYADFTREINHLKKIKNLK